MAKRTTSKTSDNLLTSEKVTPTPKTTRTRKKKAVAPAPLPKAEVEKMEEVAEISEKEELLQQIENPHPVLNVNYFEDWINWPESFAADYIKVKLAQSDHWVKRALMALYDRQTPAEKENPREVHESNGMGFSEYDQVFCSDIARSLTKGAKLSQRQIASLRDILPKYAKQLARVAKANKLEERAKLDRLSNFQTEDFFISIQERNFIATTGDLGLTELDLSKMPNEIYLHSKSGEIIWVFEYREVWYAEDGETIEAVQYGEKGQLAANKDKVISSKERFKCTIIVGEKDEKTDEEKMQEDLILDK